MSRKRNREINVFSTSAIDLFASSLGVFIILVMILFPYFGKKHKEPPAEPQQKMVTIEAHQKVVEQLSSVQEALGIKEKLMEESSSLVASLKEQIEELLASKKSLDTQSTIQQKQKEQIKEFKTQLADQKSRLDQLTQENLKLKEIASKNETQTNGLSTALEQKRELQQQLTSLKSELQDLKKNNQDLEKQLKEKESSEDDANFMAIIIQWPTQKHDIDLRVTTPSNKTYDFKTRVHKGSPARFTLDSRTGPGSEVWQTKSVEPGTYTIEYVFYNDYDNKEKAVVDGRIFTKTGEVEIPTQKLVFPTQRSVKKKFSVDKKGTVRLL
jgi:myosin heavy subunit